MFWLEIISAETIVLLHFLFSLSCAGFLGFWDFLDFWDFFGFLRFFGFLGFFREINFSLVHMTFLLFFTISYGQQKLSFAHINYFYDLIFVLGHTNFFIILNLI